MDELAQMQSQADENETISEKLIGQLNTLKSTLEAMAEEKDGMERYIERQIADQDEMACQLVTQRAKVSEGISDDADVTEVGLLEQDLLQRFALQPSLTSKKTIHRV